MSRMFENRAVIVTGASSGIGRAIAVELGGQGAELWLVGQSNSGLAETAAMIADAGGPAAHAAPMDLRERGPLAALVAEVANTHPHLFAMVNNAGVMYPEPVLSGTFERWQAMLDINIMAMLEGAQAAAVAMRAHGLPGHIINVGSVQARFEEPGVYGLSKKAAEMIGDTLRAELEQDDIRVTAIIPGGFATQLSRDFDPASLASLGSNLERLNIDPTGPDIAKIVGDPAHIARMVAYILAQPIGINIQEVVIRPPISTKV